MSDSPGRGRTRRRGWSEHPLSIPVNISWAVSGLYAVALLPIYGVSAYAWVLAAVWIALNTGVSFWIHSQREVPLEAERNDSDEVQGTSLYRDALRRLRKNQFATLSLGVLAILVIACFSQQLFWYIASDGPQDGDSFYSVHLDHTRVNKEETFSPPTARHWFGTDALGRDLFARSLFGGGISFLVGLVATVVSLLIGVSWGATSGYFGGRVDHYMMRIVDVLYGLPFMFLVILILTLVKGLDATASQHAEDVFQVIELEAAGRFEEARTLADEKEITTQIRTAVWLNDVVNPIFIMFFALGLVQWLTMARITRGQVLSLKEREFVVAARIIGAGNTRIIFRHIVPNLLGPVIIYTTLTIPTVMLAEAFLSFLGLGISQPHCSWGSLASEGLQGINVIKPYWWLVVYPGAAISLALFSLNFLGDGLRDALDPRQKR